MKKLSALLLTLSMFAGFSACGESTSESSDSSSETSTSESSVNESSEDSENSSESESSSEDENSDAEDEENYETGDASLDNPRNQDDIGENELLVISFGTSYNDSRRLNIGAIENDIEKAFPEFSVRRGFTSNIIIDHINSRDGILIDDVEAALKRSVDNGVKNLVVQPTHLMNGLEYADLAEAIAQYSDAFEKVAIGEPLLTSDEDFAKVEAALVAQTEKYDDGKTAICFMGHGTTADSNEIYSKLQTLFDADGYENYCIGTVEAKPDIDDVITKVKAGEYERVVIQPLMVVAGDHANNDMAGDEDSWKTALEAEGYEVECVLQGLGEDEAIRQIYVEHAQAAVDSIK